MLIMIRLFISYNVDNVRIPVSHGSIDFVDGFVDENDFDVNDDDNSGIFTPQLLIYIK